MSGCRNPRPKEFAGRFRSIPDRRSPLSSNLGGNFFPSECEFTSHPRFESPTCIELHPPAIPRNSGQFMGTEERFSGTDSTLNSSSCVCKSVAYCTDPATCVHLENQMVAGGDGLLSSARQYSFSKALDTCSANSSSCPQVFHRQTDSSRHEVTGPPAVQVACGARDSHRDWCTSLQVRAHGDEVPSRPRWASRRKATLICSTSRSPEAPAIDQSVSYGFPAASQDRCQAARTRRAWASTWRRASCRSRPEASNLS